MEIDKFEKQVFLTTVFIENLTDNEVGTGFLVLKKIDDKNNKILLFSNKHVFWGKANKDTPGIQREIRLTFHKKDKDGSYKPGNIFTVTGRIFRDSQTGYYDHPKTEVDVACANISQFGNEQFSLYIMGIGSDFFEFNLDDIYAGMNILFAGYPSGFFDKKNWLPVLRSGIISSIPSIPFEGKPQILLDAQVFPGSSGSPVFASIKGKYKLLGMVSDGVNKNLDFLKVENTAEKVVSTVNLPREWIGLGLLFTLETIKDVYDLA